MAKISYYLDTRRHKDQPVPLRIAIRNKNSVAYITMNEKILPSQWDADKGCLRSYPKNKKLEHPDKVRLDLFLKRHLLDIEDIVRKLPYNLPAQEIKNRIMHALGGCDPSAPLFADLYNNKIDSLKKDSTATKYKDTLRLLAKYDKEIMTKTIEEIDEDWIIRLQKYMNAHHLSNNTQVFHFSHIKATINFAKKRKIKTSDPFEDFVFRLEDTRKRSLLPNQLHQLFTLDLAEYYPGKGRRTRMQTYIDIFKLIFYLRGISFIDLCKLTKDSMVNGRIYYNRSKNATLYNIRIEPEAQILLDRYKGTKHLIFICDKHKDYKEYLSTVNDNLKTIGVYRGKGKPLFPGLTTYWARHSWATAASELDIPTDTISASLGHKLGSRVTHIYIRLNQKKVDQANRDVIDSILNYDK